MTVINPNSISGITSITLPSGDSNVLTIHTNDGTERFRIDSSGNIKVGSAATISPDGDVFFTGVTTATTFTGAHSGSGANLTSLPAAQLSGTLPAISATNLTNIPAANVTGTLPALTAANLTSIPAANIVGLATAGFERSGGFPQGVTEADSWYLTSSFSGSATPIANNLSRCNLSGDGFDKLGTGMSVSSGIWTFPSTGHWLVHGDVFYEQISGYQSRFNEFSIRATENNSSYVEVARGGSYFDNYDAQRVNNATCQAIIDCTDTSNVKIKFHMSVNESNVETQGSGSIYKTRFNFIRLADT